MTKYRAWVAQVMESEDSLDTREEALKLAMAMRDKWQAKYPNLNLYFEVDDCGREEEE